MKHIRKSHKNLILNDRQHNTFMDHIKVATMKKVFKKYV